MNVMSLKDAKWAVDTALDSWCAANNQPMPPVGLRIEMIKLLRRVHANAYCAGHDRAFEVVQNAINYEHFVKR